MKAMLAENWKSESYWLEGVPPLLQNDADLPNSADVVIVGAGYTGLNAALEVALDGRSTVVLDAATPGSGCSSRNGGQISISIKPSLEKLSLKYGRQRAKAIRDTGKYALDWIEERISAQNIKCDFRRSGRFHAAH